MMVKKIVLFFFLFNLLFAVGNEQNACLFSKNKLEVGTIVMYAGMLTEKKVEELRKNGWLVCDGRVEDEQKYRKLKNILGGSFCQGDEPMGKFRLPDLTARVPIGAKNKDLKKDISRKSALKLDGSISPVLGEIGGEFKDYITKEDINHQHSVNAQTTLTSLLAGHRWRGLPASDGSDHAHCINTNTKDPINFTSIEISTVQPYLALHFLIRWK